MESSSPTDPGVETEADEGNPARANDPEETGVASDPELEELLDSERWPLAVQLVML